MKRLNKLTICGMVTLITLAPAFRSAAEIDPQDLELVDRMERVFVDVAEKAFPATVVITSTREAPTRGSQQVPEGLEDLFEQFRRWHGMPPGMESPEMPQRRMPRSNLGSGFFISPDGYILTNSHVIEGADDIIVRMQDGREATAEIIGSDPPSDIAMIKVEIVGELPYLELGDSDQIKIGQWALAVGAPLQFDYTFTRGIISAMGRALPLPAARVQYTEQEYIQVDTLINPGNSGGPLLNTRGEVIGVNTLISGQFGYYGFAVPVNIAKRVAEAIKERGRVVRPWLGIQMRELTQDEKNYHDVDGGVLITRISDNSPAKEKGLAAGDVIVAIEGMSTPTPLDLKKMILTKLPGDQIEVEYLHKAKKETVAVELGEVPESLTQVAGMDRLPNGRSNQVLEDWGLTVQPIPSDQREQMELEQEYGIIITQVEPRSAAEKAGLAPGDVILEVNYEKVDDAGTLSRVLEESDPDKGALFYLFRNGDYGFRLVKQTD